MTAPLSPLSVEDRNEGWIEWNGGECPVPPETMVEYRFRGATPSGVNEFTGIAEPLFWNHTGTYDDIIAYRLAPTIAQPATVSTPPAQAEGGEAEKMVPVDDQGGWPPLVDLGRVLGFFASVIKSGESWSATCQREYDAANFALQAMYRELDTRPQPSAPSGEWAAKIPSVAGLKGICV